MHTSKLIDHLIDSLCCLPGVGPNLAQRIAFYLLHHGQINGKKLAENLSRAMLEVSNCNLCRTLTEEELCHICSSKIRRDSSQICVVEGPADVNAIEQTGQFGGSYFVLMGHLSPLDGVSPNEIGLDLFEARLENEQVKEVILATNSTMEGEVTANFIAKICHRYDIETTRIAYGIPVGGELEMVDGNTLSRSIVGRQKFSI
jgi:recombination protein RecR